MKAVGVDRWKLETVSPDDHAAQPGAKWRLRFFKTIGGKEFKWSTDCVTKADMFHDDLYTLIGAVVKDTVRKAEQSVSC